MPKKIISLFLLFICNISFSTNSCLSGYKHCSICNPFTNLCYLCDKETLAPDDKGGCDYTKICKYGNNFCIECSKEEESLCIKCENGYYPDEYGGCSYTKNCVLSERGQCLKCKEDYILIGRDNNFGEGIRLCKYIFSEDLKNCKTVNLLNGLCDECKEGFYLNQKDKKCSLTENCDESTFGVCIKCKNGYYLDKRDNNCKEQKDNFFLCQETINGESCDICEEDTYFDENGVCIYNNYCLKEVYNKCQKCISGYYLSEEDFSCTSDPNCKYGNRNTGICSICKDNYYIDFKDGKCKSNQEEDDFKYCKSADEVCYECISSLYILGKDNRCSTSYFCAESYNGTCIECIDNYHLGLDNKCTNIKHCIYSDSYNQCLECELDYYFDKANSICVIGEGNFTNCKIGNSGQYCYGCKDDFYLNQTDHLCYSNKEEGPFYKCSFADLYKNHCIICTKGYYIGNLDKKCSKIDGCDISENENRCSQCQKFYCLDIKTGKCHDNYIIYDEKEKFYYQCNRTNEEGNACEVCIDGYKVNENGLCVDDTLCEEKDDNGNCRKCKNNEGNFCLNNNFGCVETYIKNCLECNDLIDWDCTKCNEGFELNKKGECVEKVINYLN